VIAGSVDGSVEALAGGRLGRLVDPFDLGAIAEAIAAQLHAPLRAPDETAERFGQAAFRQRVRALLAAPPS
jgi:hypothetical protein